MTKTIITSGLTALVVALVVVMLVGSNSPAVGGETRFPNSNITAQDLTSTDDIVVGDDLSVTDDATFGSGNGSATTSINFGKACWEITTSQGSTTYAFFRSTGTLATSSTSCN